jgi:murein DD-endopeptidase MepM/ murein hydrolase activator NlpD
MVTLRAYNIKLRTAMGENVSREDSVIAAQQEGRSVGTSVTRPVETAPPPGEFERQLKSSMKDTSVAISNVDIVGLTAQHPLSNIMADLPFGTPAHGYFTHSFDIEKKHFGIDIAGKEGSPVFASAGGRVIFANWTYDDGFQIIIAHDKGYMTLYKHNQTLIKNVGDVVKRGEIIALMGNTGKMSSGPHLHFEVWRDGSVQDPMNFLLTLE